MSLLGSLFSPAYSCMDTWAPTMDNSSLGATYTCECGRRYVCTAYKPGPEPFCEWSPA